MFKFDLLPGERVEQVYRQSEAVLFKPVLAVFVLIYFPWYFLLTYGILGNFLRLLLFWTILVLFYALYKYLLWLANAYLLTDRRLVFVNYRGLFSKQVLETPLERILNIGFSTGGFWQTLFKIGDVEVRAPGLAQPLVLKNISHPSQVKDLLWHAHAAETVKKA